MITNNIVEALFSRLLVDNSGRLSEDGSVVNRINESRGRQLAHEIASDELFEELVDELNDRLVRVPLVELKVDGEDIFARDIHRYVDSEYPHVIQAPCIGGLDRRGDPVRCVLLSSVLGGADMEAHYNCFKVAETYLAEDGRLVGCESFEYVMPSYDITLRREASVSSGDYGFNEFEEYLPEEWAEMLMSSD